MFVSSGQIVSVSKPKYYLIIKLDSSIRYQCINDINEYICINDINTNDIIVSINRCINVFLDEVSHSQSRLPPFVDFNDITPARTSDCNYGGCLPYSQSMPSSLSSCGSASSSAPTNILPFLYLGSQHDALSENVITVSF